METKVAETKNRFVQLIFVSSDKIDRNRFRDILHNTFDMTDDILMDRGKIVRAACQWTFAVLVFTAFDRDNDGQVSMLEWVVGLNTYLRGTLDEKIACNADSTRRKHEGRSRSFQLPSIVTR